MATHGVLSGPAIDRLKNAPLERIVLTNTLPLPPEKQLDKIEVLSVAPLIAEALGAVFDDTSVSEIFGGENQADKDAGGGKGDSVADMANGPRAHNMQFPETVAFLETLGSANSNNCRYAACVVPTLPSEIKKER